MSETMRTFNVGFSTTDSTHDETQFDISDGPVDEMINEIIQLFNDFAHETRLLNATMIYVQEVPFEEE